MQPCLTTKTRKPAVLSFEASMQACMRLLLLFAPTPFAEATRATTFGIPVWQVKRGARNDDLHTAFLSESVSLLYRVLIK